MRCHIHCGDCAYFGTVLCFTYRLNIKKKRWIEEHEQAVMIVFWLVWLAISLLIVDY